MCVCIQREEKQSRKEMYRGRNKLYHNNTRVGRKESERLNAVSTLGLTSF